MLAFAAPASLNSEDRGILTHTMIHIIHSRIKSALSTKRGVCSMSSGLSRRREGSICKPAAEELFIA